MSQNILMIPGSMVTSACCCGRSKRSSRSRYTGQTASLTSALPTFLYSLQTPHSRRPRPQSQHGSKAVKLNYSQLYGRSLALATRTLYLREISGISGARNACVREKSTGSLRVHIVLQHPHCLRLSSPALLSSARIVRCRSEYGK